MKVPVTAGENDSPMAVTDVLIVSLGGTTGLREADAELAASLERAGASVATVRAAPPREWRTPVRHATSMPRAFCAVTIARVRKV